MAKSPEEMEASMIAGFAENTGKTLEQWLKIVLKSGIAKHGEIVKMLKADHGIGHGYANMVAHKHLQAAAGGPVAADDLIEAQYAGPKAALRPLYDKLVEVVRRFGADIEIAPKKAYVSLRRAKQFALIQPSTASRLDIGLNLKGVEPGGRLEASGSFSAMCTHRVKIANVKELGAEVTAWLKKAYDAAS